MRVEVVSWPANSRPAGHRRLAVGAAVEDRDAFGQRAELAAVGERDAEQLADHQYWQRKGEQFGQVDRLAGARVVRGGHVVEAAVGEFPDVLGERTHPLCGERGREHAAHPLVLTFLGVVVAGGPGLQCRVRDACRLLGRRMGATETAVPEDFADLLVGGHQPGQVPGRRDHPGQWCPAA